MEDQTLLEKLITILCVAVGGGTLIIFFMYRAFRKEVPFNSEDKKDIIDLDDKYHGGKN